MPELPEVETVVRDLRPLLVGRTIRSVTAGPAGLRRPWDRDWNPRLTGATVESVGRRGKWILVALDRPDRLLLHLGMTGQLTVTAADAPVPNHLHLCFALGEGTTQLRFRDPRRFGSADLFADQVALTAFLDGRLGPEPFDLTAGAFLMSVQKSNRPLKAILLDQAVVAGVGNIYADEALHRAGLHPETRGKAVTAEQAEALRGAIAAVLTHAIENRGSTIRDYVGGSGLRGGFQAEFRVYGLDGEPCVACETTLKLVRVAGRSSHFCPQCQPG